MPVVDTSKQKNKKKKKFVNKAEILDNIPNSSVIPTSPSVKQFNVTITNKANETNSEKKGIQTLSMWMRTVVAGDVYQYLKTKLSQLKVKPSSKLNHLWHCLHSEMRRIMVKTYKFSDPDDFRNHIQKIGMCYKNVDLSMPTLAETYQIHLQILSLNQDFKTFIYGEQFSTKMELLHVGYDYFIAIVQNDKDTCDELCEEEIDILKEINLKREGLTYGDIKKDKELIQRLRLLLQGTERAQDSPDTPKDNTKKKAYYDIYPLKELEKNMNLEICSLHIKNAHLAYATIIKKIGGKENIISIMGRKNCGFNAFEGDTVYVEINDRENLTGKVLGVRESSHKPINSIYVCKVCRDQGSLMMPLDGSLPKIHVDNEPGRRRYESEQRKNMGKQESSRLADNLYVSIYTMQRDKKTKEKTISVLSVEKIDPETCDKLFLVHYDYWDISFMYPLGKVVGIISTYDSFKDMLHLILPLCKVEPLVINSRYKNEIQSIRKKVKEIKDIPHDIVPEGAMVFTIDNEETQDMDDALSYHVKDGGVVIGVHISDITKYISPEHEVYKQAHRRFSTAYTPSHLGEEPIYLIEKELTTDCFSLVRNKPRAVLSVMFHFPKEGGPLPGSVTFGETFIKSKYKLSYKEVEGWIKETSCPRDMEEDLFIAIKGCYEKARMIRRGRLPISYFVRQSNYNKPGMQFDDNFNAQFLIEEFMIMANEHVAKKIYESYPNMGLIRVQDPVVDYQEWENRLFELSNLNFPSSLGQCCNLLGIRRSNENHKDLVVSRQYYDDFVKFLKEDLNKARNMISYDVYINDFYLHLSEWYRICNPARYECSLEGCVENRHFSLDKDIYTHFTSPIRRFSDVIVHMMLKSVLHGNTDAYGLDERMVSEVCIIANQRSKTNKLFEKYCAPYAIFEATPSVYNFVLDCVCSDITNEKLNFVHPMLNRSACTKSIKFSHLSLNAPPVQVKFKEPITSCNLKWRRIIFSRESICNNSPKNTFKIDNNLYDVKLSESAHKLFRKIRRSYLSTSELAGDLKELSDQFKGKVSHDIISSDSSTDPIIEICMPLFVKNTIRIQFCSYKVHGLKRVTPELLIVHPSLQLCLIHQEDPVMCFVPGGKLELEHNDIIWEFRSIFQYKKYFIPLLQLESLKEILSQQSEFSLLDVPISWIKAKSSMTNKEERFGIIKYNAEICESKNIKFSEENDEFETNYENVIADGLSSVTGDLLCLRGTSKKWNNYWVGHGAVVNVSQYQENEVSPILKVIVFMLTQSDFDISHADFRIMTFTVEVFLQSISSKRQFLAVSSIEKDNFLREVILGSEIDSMEKDETMLQYVLKELEKQRMPALNRMQNRAVTKAMTEKLSLIWGPPGTGKTSIGCILSYCYCVKNAKLNNDGVILYCGPSNECVNLVKNTIKEKFKENCPRIVRIFGDQQELADFPLPGFFSGNKPLNAGMLEVSLHHLIREMEGPLAKQLKDYDAKFQEWRQSPHLFSRERNEGKSVYETIKEYKDVLKEAKFELIDKKKYNMVICTTSVSANTIINRFNVTQVIIDEAGMCKEPETLIPILNASNSVENVVLIGDHKQLRPIILDNLANKRGLQISLFERYQFLKPSHVTMLNFQYRMHPSICEFPSKHFYSGRLFTRPSLKWSGLSKSDFKNGFNYKNWNGVDYHHARDYYKSCLKSSGYSLIPDNMWPGQRRERYSSFTPMFQCCPERLVFIHVVGDEDVQSVSTTTCGENSRSNKAEVAAVGYIYDKLISRFDPPRHASGHITVLTQYRLQEDLLFKACKEKLTKRRIATDPIVKTVIRSQGSENDYVIFSTVRSLRNDEDIISNPSPGWEKKNLGFITDENQVNVALTRAQKGLIIIGNRNLLSVNKMWYKLLNDLNNRGCVLEDFTAFL